MLVNNEKGKAKMAQCVNDFPHENDGDYQSIVYPQVYTYRVKYHCRMLLIFCSVLVCFVKALYFLL